MRRSARIAGLTPNPTSISTMPNRKRKVAEIIVPVKQLHFHGPYIRQNWPFRDSLINYTTKTPSNSKAWQKLIKSCKYVFAKNPILVIENLWWDEEDWYASSNNDAGPVDFTKISSKLWITDKFNATCAPPENVSLIIPKIYKCDAKYLSLMNDVISYKDFLFLSSNVEDTVLRENIVKNSDGSIVSLEKLIAVLPKIKSIFL
uniref:Uncharacterized protein n=1 Tax=Panagrolaimus davidi TaxID=227884 RepID=A0A914P6Z4_9BILA